MTLEDVIVNGEIYDIEEVLGKAEVPISKFNLNCSYHQKLCFNWTNLQILKANKNRKKYNKI